jgi:hypothetical protein
MPDKKIPELTQEQGQRFFKAFLKDKTEPAYAECMGWDHTKVVLAEIFGVEPYAVNDFIHEHFFKQFWEDRERRRAKIGAYYERQERMENERIQAENTVDGTGMIDYLDGVKQRRRAVQA